MRRQITAVFGLATICAAVLLLAALSSLAVAQKGKTRLLAVATPQRLSYFPDAPTCRELGIDWVDGAYRGVGVPKSTPEDMRKRVSEIFSEIGRDPDDIKVLFLAYPIMDTTMEAARDRRQLEREDAEKNIDMQLSGMSRITGIDFSKFDLDQPLPELKTNGHQSSLAKWIGKTPRSIVQSYASKAGIDFTGTIDHVAGMMQEIMQEVGGDGFLLFNGYFDRRYIMEVCDGLVPELQRRGLTRTGYSHQCFKDNLLEF